MGRLSLEWPGMAFAALIFLGLVFPSSLGVTPAVLALLVLSHAAMRERRFPFAIDKGLAIALGAVVVLGLSSALWSVAPEHSVMRSVKVAGLFFAGFLFFTAWTHASPESRTVLMRLMPWVTIAGGTVIVVELYFQFPLYRFISARTEELPTHLLNKHIAFFTLCSFASFYVCARERRYFEGGGIVLILAAIMFETQSQAAQIATITGFILAALCVFSRKAAFALVGGGLLILLFALPFTAPPVFQALVERSDTEAINKAQSGFIFQSSLMLRLENYDFIARKIQERPLTGYGMDSTRHLVFDTNRIFYNSDKILHPHNVFLQIWLDFGLTGAIGFMVFFIYLLVRLYRLEGQSRVLSLCLFAMICIFFLVSWSMWASWMIGMAFVISALVPALQTGQNKIHES